MTHPENENLQTTPLTRWHSENGGRMVPFAGFEMPVQYRGVLAEHAVVREKVGLFDITHMGEIMVRGDDAAAWLDSLATNRIIDQEPGKITYTAMCRPDGGVLDDMLIYRMEADLWMVVCNAANHAKIAAWLNEQSAGHAVQLDDVSDATAMIAVQGPDALTLVKRMSALAGVGETIDGLDFYTTFAVDGPSGRWIVSRTGYTGERGYELYIPNADALPLWEELLREGADLGVEPIGLAARDSLRFEVAYCLYGHELSEEWTPLEAGIGWAVRLKNREFIGSEALRTQKANGVPRKLIAIEIPGQVVNGRQRPAPIARQDAVLMSGGKAIGHVTSGTKSPTLGRSLALALVDVEIANDESAVLTVVIRDKEIPAVRTSYPFLAARVKGDPRAER
jgi:glycine cleavage system T protein (aminomethyltransferase)